VLDEIHAVMKQQPEKDYEIICVNDSSPDNVLELLKTKIAHDNRLIVADLAKNMGKACAILAGYSLVSGDYIINIDDDGQCPLDELWTMFKKISAGYDVVFAAYTIKRHSAFKRLGSHINSLMSYYLIGKPKGLKTSNFSMLKRFIVKEVVKNYNSYPYISGQIIKTTNRIANVPLEERNRTVGDSNFTFRKSLSLWLNGFTAFSVLPLRVSSLIGCLTAILGFGYGIVIVVQRLFINPNMALGFPTIIATMLLIGGVIMMMLGMLGEYVGRIYINQNNLPQYVIRNTYKAIDHENSSLQIHLEV